MGSEPAPDAVIGRRVLVNTVSNFAGKLLTLGVGFVLTPFILGQLGATNFGLWALVGSFVGYGSLLDLGISGAVVKYVAEYRAKGEMERAHTLVATALTLYTVLGVLAVLACAALAPIFPSLFNLPPDRRSEASWLLLLMGTTLGLSLPASTTGAVLRGLQRFDLVNLLNVIATIISTVSIVVVLLAGGGLLGLVAVGIPLTLLMQAPSIWLIRRIAPDLRFGWHGADWRQSRAIFTFSSALLVMNLAGQLESETDELVIGAFMPLRFITPFALARRLSEVAQILTDQFMKVLLPLASELDAANERQRLRALYTTSTRLTLAIFLPVACVLFVFPGQILTAWVGAEYAVYANLVIILTLGNLIATSQWPAGSILQGMARHRLLALMALGSGLANLALSLALVGPLGLTGVALGTLIPYALECLGLVLPYVMRVLQVTGRQVLREILLPTLLPAGPTALVLLMLQQAIQPASLLTLAAVALAGAVVYASGYIVMGASAFERQTYQNLARTTLRLAQTRLRS